MRQGFVGKVFFTRSGRGKCDDAGGVGDVVIVVKEAVVVGCKVSSFLGVKRCRVGRNRVVFVNGTVVARTRLVHNNGEHRKRD